jgi:hypothetical protein
MAKNLLDQAQICMDDFNQSFAPANAFYTLEDFGYRLIDERDNLLETEFLVQYYKNKNQFPIINSQWLSREVVDVKKDEEGRWYADSCIPLFEFPFDERGFAIQNVTPLGGGDCAQFVRIPNDQQWQICMLVANSMNYFSVEKCRIWLYNFFNCCQKLELSIVPSQAGLSLENQTLPDGKAAQIREVVLNKAFRDMNAKLGKISQHNDGNANPNPNETSAIYTDIKTK